MKRHLLVVIEIDIKKDTIYKKNKQMLIDTLN